MPNNLLKNKTFTNDYTENIVDELSGYVEKIVDEDGSLKTKWIQTDYFLEKKRWRMDEIG